MLTFVLAGCGSAPLTRSEIFKVGAAPPLSDDLNLQGLHESINDHIRFFREVPSRTLTEFRFGDRVIAAADYVLALEKLLTILPEGGEATAADQEKVFNHLRSEFDCLEGQGEGRPGEAFITSYFDPIIRASAKPSSQHSRPIYRAPNDMVMIKLEEFKSVFPHWSIFNMTEQKSSEPLARGRIYKKRGVQYVTPYYSRFEIDSVGLLRGKGLEIAYADPLDIFIMQIQGSGTLLFDDGSKVRVGYASQNGHPYQPLGRFLKDRIPASEMSLMSIRRVMNSLPPEQAETLMALNPSYVFFTHLKGEPLTTLGTPVRAGRTIASDRSYFPKGTLAFVQFEKPVFEASAEMPSRFEKAGRLVMDQDTGGAIRGIHRLDLYWGHGPEAEKAAGVMKQWGRLCHLVPKVRK
jgi:membrane-bound lytic murein transglycosylase A